MYAVITFVQHIQVRVIVRYILPGEFHVLRQVMVNVGIIESSIRIRRKVIHTSTKSVRFKVSLATGHCA